MTRHINDRFQEEIVLHVETAVQAMASTSPVAATGTITCVTTANFADSDYMTIGDGLTPAKLYEFDKAGDGVTSGRVQVNISTDTTAAQCAARLRTAILANQPALNVVDNSNGTLSLTHKWLGAGGNVTMTENVANAGFLVAGLSGGVDSVLTGSTAATATQPFHKFEGRAYRVESVQYLSATGFAVAPSDYWTIELKNGANSVAKWSTQTGHEGTITGGTPVELVPTVTTANLIYAVGDIASVVLTKTGSPAALPPGRIVVHGRYV